MKSQRNEPSRAHFGLFPQTPLGRRAAWLLGVGLALFGATTLLANAGGQGGTGWIVLMIIPAFVAMFGGAIAAAVAVVRDHERGGVARIPLLAGLYVGFLVIGEFVVPH